MTKDQISAAKDRAAEVVNGFKTVRHQQARDVIALADAITQRDIEIDALKKKVLGLELQAVGSTRAGAASKADDILGRIFGGH